MSDINILIVEDDLVSTYYLTSILKSLNFSNIFDASNMKDALDVVKKNKIDIAFMDININGSVDGITCAKILNEYYFLPIIYTTAYGDSATILEASETNSFGYLIKPFEENDVEATLLITLKRIKSLQNTLQPLKKTQIDFIELSHGQKYNFSNKTFYVNNIAIQLTQKELDVLYILCKNSNQNISYDTLKENIWNNKEITTSTIRDTISRLKRKAPNLRIENVISFGYILKI